jgi:hypothetical protein
LVSDGGQEIFNDLGVVVNDTMTPDTIANSVVSSQICQFSDMNTYAEKTFGEKVRNKFGDGAKEIMEKIVSVALVTIIGIYILKSILCAFNISFKNINGCSVRSFEWGQCN